MKKVYTEFDEFNDDLDKEYNFKDIAIINGWLSERDFKGYMIKCPFHGDGHERTGSCQIGEHFFRCYGCGAKGSIFTFAMMKNNESFIESANEIAISVGSSLNINGYDYSKIKEKSDKLKYEWDKYLRDFENNSKDVRIQKIAKKYFPFDVGYNKEGERVVLPFISQSGKILGFTERTIKDIEDPNIEDPKWKHSSIYNSLVLECLNIFNLKGLIGQKEAYIVEGPGDVAGFVRVGYKNSICVCGTSNFNTKTLELLVSKGIKRFTFCPDGDEAGKKALMKWLEILARYDFVIFKDCRVIILDEQYDPGNAPKDYLKDKINNYESGIEYYMNQLDDLTVREIYNKKENKGSLVFKKFIKDYIIDKYDFNNEEVEEFFKTGQKKVQNEDVFKDRLKATIGVKGYENFEILDMSAEQARKILKLKYHETV